MKNMEEYRSFIKFFNCIDGNHQVGNFDMNNALHFKYSELEISKMHPRKNRC